MQPIDNKRVNGGGAGVAAKWGGGAWAVGSDIESLARLLESDSINEKNTHYDPP